MYYFTPFPRVTYDPTGKSVPVLAYDITKRFKLSYIMKNSRLVFYEYAIKDRDRPDIMAEVYYENSQLDWIFFLTNSIWDPYFQWPLTQLQFESYIRSKYGSTSNALAQVHHYEQIVVPRKEMFVNFDGTEINIEEKTVVVDQTTYLSLPSNRRKVIDCLTYEENENNRKRNIRILEKAYLPQLLREFKQVFSV